MPFSIGTGLEHVGIAGPELDLSLGRSAGSRRQTPLQKQERKKGRRGLRRWPLRCLSQFLPERKTDCLEGECSTYLSLKGWPDIYIAFVFPIGW